MDEELEDVLARWATRRYGLRWSNGVRPVGSLLYASGGEEENGTPYIDVRDHRVGRERLYRVRFTRRGPTVWEWKNGRLERLGVG